MSSTAKQDNDTKQLRRPTGPRVLPDHDKGRNKRLFGSLLGTLAQPARTSTVSSKRKDDIERKQAAKLRQRDEEFAASARDRESEALVRREEQAVRDETQAARREEQATSRAELDEKRKQQQRAWDEESTRIRHANMRAMAGFLLTEAEPRLYWRPWEMLRGQEERVERRREEVEEGIRRELDDAGPEPSHTNGVAEAFEADTSDISAPRRTSGGQPGDAAGSEPGDEKRLDGSGAAPVEGTRASVLPAGTSAEHQGAGDTHLLEENGDDHENDEVANAGEDAVIY